jgi:hypothetical protein
MKWYSIVSFGWPKLSRTLFAGVCAEAGAGERTHAIAIKTSNRKTTKTLGLANMDILLS